MQVGMIQNEDALAQAINADDAAARQGYVHAQDRHIELLRNELAAERTAKLAAESLCSRYAGLIGEQKEALRKGSTVDGITQAIRKLEPHHITPGAVGWLITALSNKVDAMVQDCAWSELDFIPHELDFMAAHCQDTQADVEAVDVDEVPPRGPIREGQEL